MNKLIFSLITILCLIGCSADSQNANGGFGAPITAEGAISLAELTKKMDSEEKVETKVIGKVAEVCQAKGCWMNLVNEQGDEIFVKFKDYGFFMPLDCAGKKVIMDGYAYKEVTSVDELRHYAEDNGDTPEQIAAITAPKEELKFMASGVIFAQ